MSVRIYVEGGGNNKDTLKRCNEGFARYCQKIAPANRRPRIVACGGRQQAFDKFQIAVRNSEPDEICVLLVDSEGPVHAAAIQHLRERDGWQFPALDRHRVFLMVQAMEAWFLADRATLAAFYNGGFLANSLPGNTNIESVEKDHLEPILKHASKPTATKGEYHKTKHGFALLELVEPDIVGKASSHAKLFNDFIRNL